MQPDPRLSADLSFLGNRLPDRESRVEEFFLSVAGQLPEKKFLLAGSGWGDKPRSGNVSYLGHLGSREHNAFNSSPVAVLNISRDSMAKNGYSPATRVFEAAGAAACMITDRWEGIEEFFEPERETSPPFAAPCSTTRLTSSWGSTATRSGRPTASSSAPTCTRGSRWGAG